MHELSLEACSFASYLACSITSTLLQVLRGSLGKPDGFLGNTIWVCYTEWVEENMSKSCQTLLARKPLTDDSIININFSVHLAIHTEYPVF